MMGMLGKAFGWLLNRWVFSVLGIILLALLVWFVGPLVAVAGYQPLVEPVPRLVTILVLVLLWGIRYVWVAARAKQTNAQVIEGLTVSPGESDAEAVDSHASGEEIAILRERFREALSVLKKAKLGGRRGRRQLYQLPWYLMIGPPGAGKTTALKNSGLRFPLMEKFGNDAIQGVGGTRNCDWWFTDEAVLLDTAGRYTTQDSDQAADRAAWAGFLDLLKRHRRRRPIDGVLIAFSVTELAQQNADERSQHARAVRQRLQELYETLKLQVPVYVIFTKCDLVAGFIEYFDDLDRDQRGQVWGFTFPIETSQRPGAVVEAFGPEFDALMERLDGRLFARLDKERDINRRGAIQGYVQQMASLKEPLQEFLAEVFQASRFENANLLRGVYLSSGTQEGTPIDRVISSIAGTFGLDRQVLPAFSGPGRSYFLTRLLRDVVFQEADLVGHTGWFDRFRAGFQWAAYTAAAAVLALLGLAWLTSYARNQDYIADVEENVAAYEQSAGSLFSGRGSVLEVLPLLNALRTLPGGYEDRDKSVPITMGFGLYQGDKLGDAARTAYRRSLTYMMLPRIMARIEGQIEENVGNPGLLYEALKVYLMLGTPRHLDRDLVEAWIALDWDTRLAGPGNAKVRDDLRRHLSALLQGELRPPPLDGTLVAQARAVLLRQPLSVRVYRRIERDSRGGQLREWRITDRLGEAATRYFRRKSGKPLSEGIPGLFTYAGFRDHFLAKGQSLIREAAGETWVLGPEYEGGLDADQLQGLIREVTELYLADYIRRWEAFLADMDIVAFRDFDHAVEVVNALSAIDSPIKTFLRAVSEQTRLANAPVEVAGGARTSSRLRQVKERLSKLLDLAPEAKAMTPNLDPFLAVDRRFQRIHALAGTNDQAPAPIDQVLSLLKDLYLHLASISGADRRGDAARAAAAGDSSVVQRVKLEADRLPDPVGRWLRRMARASSQITVGVVRARLDAIWSTEVAPYCQRALDNRYPLSRSSPQDANLNDFARYFGPQGLVDQFFKTYLAPFVDTSVRPWRTLSSGGARVGISDGALRQFEAAARIREAYFTGAGATPTVSFEIKPVSLHKSASQVLLEVGEQKLAYRHGPPRLERMQWPAPSGSSRARVVFTALGGGRTATVSADGPWAWFRLLDQGRIEPTAMADRFKVAFEAQGLTATFELRAGSVANPFRLDAIQGFRCLERL
ncbi:MAG: type VI secretion system membrane subunit TssM [Kiloniellaceae bacterium]